MQKSDATTFDLGQARLRLKDGLKFAIQHSRRGSWYLIEDESRSQFFRVGSAEYTFISQMDGETTMASAMAKTCSLVGGNALDEQEAINLCKWLVDSGLANTRASTSTERLKDQQETRNAQLNVQKLNPISIRIPICDLDRFTTAIEKYLGWLVSWPIAIVWIATCLYALISLAMAWDQVGQFNLLSRNNLIWMAVTWIVLKGIHELAHVLVCKRFGGRIGKGGILFLLLIPMPFVDVTSAWRFPNKYQRILTSAAGMLVEIFLAAIAAIVWANTSPGALNFHAANVMIAASLHTLIFNANPLMRFDGYHMLADWLELPNLGNRSQRYVSGKFKQWFFGCETKPLEYAGFHGQVIRAYGFAALAWKVLLCLVLTIAAANLLEGVGLLVAGGAALLWAGLPIIKLAKYTLFGSEFEKPNRIRFALVCGSMIAASVAMAVTVPAPSVVSAPIIVDYKPLTVVRAETSGFVSEIHVANQQTVQAGELLVVLRNRELEAELAQVVSEVAKSKLRGKSLKKQEKIAEWQAEQAAQESLEEQLGELQGKQDRLKIYAAESGRLIARDLASKLGTHLEAGTELCSIGTEECKEAIALVSQSDARHIANSENSQVDLRIWGRPQLKSAKLASLTPRARDDLPHFAFAGAYGGPLDVVQRNQVEQESATSELEGELMLTEPRVQVWLELDPQTSLGLRAGETGLAHLRGRSSSMGDYLWEKSFRWLKNQIVESHGF